MMKINLKLGSGIELGSVEIPDWLGKKLQVKDGETVTITGATRKAAKLANGKYLPLSQTSPKLYLPEQYQADLWLVGDFHGYLGIQKLGLDGQLSAIEFTNEKTRENYAAKMVEKGYQYQKIDGLYRV